jgi:hypothetical protein
MMDEWQKPAAFTQYEAGSLFLRNPEGNELDIEIIIIDRLI